MSRGGYGPEGIKTVHFLLETSADALDPRPTSMRCDVAGTATFVDDNGEDLEYHLVVGEILPFSPVKFTAGTAVLFGWL